MPKDVLAPHSESHFFDPGQLIGIFHSGHYPNKQEEELLEWLKDKLHQLFVSGKYSGKTILDVGTGPVVYTVITASRWFDEIYLTDVSAANIEFLRRWMRGESDHMNYLMKQFALKEGNGVTADDKNRFVREKVKAAIQWNVLKPEMLSGTEIDGVHFDLVTACLMMSGAASCIEEYARIVQSIRDLLNPGGVFVIGDVMDEKWYAVGNQRFSLLCLTEKEIKTTFKTSGFEIEHFETLKLSKYAEPNTTGAQTVYFIVGKKIS